MNAPLIWIFLPLLAGGFVLLFIWQERTAALFGGMVAVLLAGIALIVPIDLAMRLGPVSLKIAPSVQLFGRSLALNASDAPLLALLYGLTALWFFGSEAAGVARRLVSLGMIVTGLLVASIAVEPFLFAALLIEIAVLMAIPMLSPPDQRPGRGLIRFLIYQTLGMPFILFAGWLLAGVEASPADLALTVQSATILGLGFAFLLAIFPLYNWIPLLIEETSPFVVGFLLWLLPTMATIFGMGFLDRYAWLRTSSQLPQALQAAGLIMVATGGLWAAFQRSFGRIMAYAAIAETGFVLLALGLIPGAGVEITFLLLIPRGLSLAMWALSLSILSSGNEPLDFSSVQGLARTYPLAAAGMVLAALSSAGLPLLAGFPPRLALWEGLALESYGAALWFLVGLLGLLTGAVRMLAVLVMAEEDTAWASNETRSQRAMLGFGMIALLILGILPQLARPLLANLPLMFLHLGR